MLSSSFQSAVCSFGDSDHTAATREGLRAAEVQSRAGSVPARPEPGPLCTATSGRCMPGGAAAGKWLRQIHSQVCPTPRLRPQTAPPAGPCVSWSRHSEPRDLPSCILAADLPHLLRPAASVQIFTERFSHHERLGSEICLCRTAKAHFS